MSGFYVKTFSNFNPCSFQLRVVSETTHHHLIDTSAFADITLAEYYVIIVDDLHKVSSALKSISKWPSFNQNGKFIILFNNPVIRTGAEDQALDILTMMYKKFRAVNVVFAIASDSFFYEIYTGDPYHGTKGDCGKMKMIEIGQFHLQNLTNPTLTRFHLELSKVPPSMANCTFKMCARISKPFVNADCKDGLEIEIIHFLQSAMKFNVLSFK